MDKMTKRSRIWIFVLFILSTSSGNFLNEPDAGAVLTGIVGLAICIGIMVFALDTNGD